MEKSDIAKITIENISDVRFIVQILNEVSLVNQSSLIEIAPNTVTSIQVDGGASMDSIDIQVLNAFIAPKKNLKTTISF